MRNILIVLLAFTFTNAFGQTDFQKLFDSFSLKGSTTVYDLKNKRWFYTDSLDTERETLPASTFKILNSLIALENKVVADESQLIKWDGADKTFFGTKIESWNKDTDLKTAYKNSTIWFYVEVAKKIGRKKYKKYLKKCGYGNNELTEKGVDFWNYGNFGISPGNQIEFLIKLYKNDLPFSKTTLDKVKEIMISENAENYTIRDKSGWTKKNGIDIGWYVGYLQTNDNIYFFATRITKNINDSNPDFSKARKEITIAILKELKAI
ncbi:class D beta-lactamase [Flavobacterium sp. H122]|uniref:class D beta-lactamase n=1 Tax=Flavobacterium sp. H122 TaxID=2529860 RepID=UPI0010AB0E4F|nr:class D beta-lactamase [Flavobacterium sp. H122]